MQQPRDAAPAATRFLCGTGSLCLDGLHDCKAATVITGWSVTLQQSVVVAITCKRWGCRFCGQQKVRKLASIAAEAEPNRFVTLTVNPKLYGSPREAFEQTRRKIGALTQHVRRNHGPMEYLRVLEVTKKGWPHYHLVARMPYVQQSELSTVWAEHTGAPIVDIRKIRKNKDVFFYVVKYLSKQAYIEWTNRRVTMTKNFDVGKSERCSPSLELLEVKRENMHPETYFHYNLRGLVVERISPLVFRVVGPGKLQQELRPADHPLEPSTDGF